MGYFVVAFCGGHKVEERTSAKKTVLCVRHIYEQ